MKETGQLSEGVLHWSEQIRQSWRRLVVVDEVRSGLRVCDSGLLLAYLTHVKYIDSIEVQIQMKQNSRKISLQNSVSQIIFALGEQPCPDNQDDRIRQIQLEESFIDKIKRQKQKLELMRNLFRENERRIAQAEEASKDLQTELTHLNERLRNKENQCFEHNRENKRLSRQLQKHQEQKQQFFAQIQSLKRLSLQVQRQKLEKIESLEKQLEKCSEDRRGLSLLLDQQRRNLREAKKDNATVLLEIKSGQSKIARLTEVCDIKCRELEQAKLKQEAFDREFKAASDRETELASALCRAESELSLVRDRLKETSSKQHQTELGARRREAELQKLKANLAKADEYIKSKAKRIEQLEGQLQEAVGRRDELQRVLESCRSTRTKSERLMQSKRQLLGQRNKEWEFIEANFQSLLDRLESKHRPT